MQVPTIITKGAAKVGRVSPEILMGVGIVGLIAAGVLACRATLKCNEIIEEHEEVQDKIEDAYTKHDREKYSEKDYKRDIVIANSQTAWKFVKLYAFPVALGALSVGAIVGGHNILNKRNIALAGAVRLVKEGFDKYRSRVVEELGEAKDLHFRYGTIEEEVTETIVDEDGKKHKVKKTVQKVNKEGLSDYARMFEPEERFGDGSWTGSTQWSNVDNYNYVFVTGKQNWVNDRLNAVGHVFLNEVYEELGFQKTSEGQVVGWLRKDKGGLDGHISFGPGVDVLAYSDGEPFVLDFNVDGPIWDLI